MEGHLDGLLVVMGFFSVAVLIATALFYWYTRYLRSTLMVISCSLVAVVWQKGLLATLGYQMDPFSIRVPFPVFAIGVSHGAQKAVLLMTCLSCGDSKCS